MCVCRGKGKTISQTWVNRITWLQTPSLSFCSQIRTRRVFSRECLSSLYILQHVYPIFPFYVTIFICHYQWQQHQSVCCFNSTDSIGILTAKQRVDEDSEVWHVLDERAWLFFKTRPFSTTFIPCCSWMGWRQMIVTEWLSKNNILAWQTNRLNIPEWVLLLLSGANALEEPKLTPPSRPSIRPFIMETCN